MTSYLSQSLDTVPALQLRPALRARLAAMLNTWKDLKSDIGALQHLADIEKHEIGGLLIEAEITNLDLDETIMYWVRGATTKTLDKKKLLAQGVTLAQIDAATVEKPKKDFFTMRAKKDTDAFTSSQDVEGD